MSKPVIHGRDHSHGGADPVGIEYEDVGSGNPAAWTDLVTSLGPVFWWDFQDDTTDGQFNDITGNGHSLTLGSSGGGLFTRTNEAHMFAYQTYSGKSTTSISCYCLALPPGSWANGRTAFTAEVWFRLIAGGTRGYLVGNDVDSAGAGSWSLGFNSVGELQLKRFGGGTLTTTFTPVANVWHQYVVTSDATACTVYVDGVAKGTLPDAAGTGSYVILAREAISGGGGTYATVPGYWGAVVGYPSFMTATQVADLHTAGVTSGNPGGV